jgi:quercetin dioxygenase-like cupin family protein
MIIARNDESKPTKGWYSELTRGGLPSIGFANQGIKERHYHRKSYEVYLVVRGSSTIRVNQTTTTLHAGDVIVVEPGELHTFQDNTSNYFHFVLHCPPTVNDKVVVP